MSALTPILTVMSGETRLDRCPRCGHEIDPPGSGHFIGSGHGTQQGQQPQHRRECPNPDCGAVLRLVQGEWQVSENE